MRNRLLPVIVAALLFVAGAMPGAQKAKLLDSATFYQMESISNPTISPDGSTIVFSRGYVDMSRDQSRSNLWVINVAGDRLRQLTDGPDRKSVV